MHDGRPCVDREPNEYFKDGITNGAQWYNVAGQCMISSDVSSQAESRIVC